eukprot:scaffold89999_cov63-Phaeocystis_antarctica.AAC.1
MNSARLAQACGFKVRRLWIRVERKKLVWQRGHSRRRLISPPAGRRRPTHACGDASGEAAGSGSGQRAEEAGSQRAQRVRRLGARYRRLAGARPRARLARVELAVQRREGDSRRGCAGHAE